MSEKGTRFDDEFLKKLEYLNLVSNHMIPGHMHGEHRAKKKTSSGIEFADYQQYVSGEDTKNVDWRTYLRLDKLIVRLFEEEADLPIYIFFDASASMTYGVPAKYDYARKISAALCYVGLLVVVVSDFMDEAGFTKGFDMLRYFRQDLFAVHIHSPEEVRPDLPDEVLLEDAERGTSQRVRVTPALLDAYAQQFEEHCEEVSGYCRKNGWGYVRTTTDIPFEDLILQVFRQGRFLR